MARHRQHGTPLLLSDPDGSATPLIACRLGEPPFKEETLQRLIFERPELLGVIEELEPAFLPLIPLAREVRTLAGPVDAMFVSPTGLLTIVETKLWKNPEARREVVGQILDYAKEVAAWDVATLNEAVVAAGGTAAVDAARAWASREDEEFDERALLDGLARNLRVGRFLLLVVGDGIREGVQSLAQYLQEAPGLRFTLALVELCLYRVDPRKDFPLYVQPRVVARTAEIVRAVVDVRSMPSDAAPRLSIAVPRTEGGGRVGGRVTLSEEAFYDSLRVNTSEGTSGSFGGLWKK